MKRGLMLGILLLLLCAIVIAPPPPPPAPVATSPSEVEELLENEELEQLGNGLVQNEEVEDDIVEGLIERSPSREPDEEEEAFMSGTMWIVLGVTIMLAGGIALYFLLRKKEQPPVMPPQSQGPPPPQIQQTTAQPPTKPPQ